MKMKMKNFRQLIYLSGMKFTATVSVDLKIFRAEIEDFPGLCLSTLDYSRKFQ